MKIIKIIGVVLCLTILFSSWKTAKSQNVPKQNPYAEIEKFIENNNLSNNPKLPNVRNIEILNRGVKEYPLVDQDQLTYLQTKPDDSPMFGSSLAVSDQYLAVGDIKANRVVIYGRQADNSWLRLYEIYPPKPWFRLGRRKKSGFGYNLAINHDVLLIQDKDYENFSPTLFQDKIVKEEIYLVSLDTTETKSLKRLRLPKIDLYSGGLNFLEDQVALVVRNKKSSDKITSNVFLFDSITGKRLNNIEISDPDYDNLQISDLGIDSDGKSLVIIRREDPLIEKPPLLITKNGEIQAIKLKEQDLDATTVVVGNISVQGKSVSISNSMLAIGTDSDVTAIWEIFPQPSLKGIVAPIGGMDSKNNDVLISDPLFPFFSHRGSSDYIFVRKRENQTIFTSDIRWSCPEKVRKGRTLGLLDEENLILSAYGTIAVVPIEILTDSLEIYYPNCEAK